MYIFKMRSLTQAIDDRIHRVVRQAAPGKYWAFRLSELLTRIGSGLFILALALYFSAYMVAHAAGHLTSPEFDRLGQGFALVLVACAATSLIGGIVRETLLKDLETIAESALTRIARPGGKVCLIRP